MNLLSINVASSGPMSVQGEDIRTGFYKRPTAGPLAIDHIGVAGDERIACATDLNRAVFMYQSRYYDEWREELARPLTFGIFGENLTFDGPPDTEFYLGDVLEVGGAKLRITQPRFPCRKMTVRMGEGDDFPLRYLQSGRLGFFCNVDQPGVVEAGYKIRIVHRTKSDPIPLSEFARITYFRPDDQEGLERMLASPDLVPEWRLKVERLLRRARGPTGGWHEYRPLVVSCRHRLSPEVVSLDLHDPAGERLPVFDGGQFLTVRLDVPNQVKPVVRTYTIVGRSDDDRGYQLAVKRELPPPGQPALPAGVASNLLHDEVNQGTTLLALAPRGHFIVEPGSRPIVLLSVGIGVTPMLAMLDYLGTCPLKRQVLFVHGARSGREHVFGARVRELVANTEFLRSHVFYSQPGPDDTQGRDFDAPGRLSVEKLDGVLPSFNADFYLCGPELFMRDMVLGLMSRGVPKEQLRYEFFGAGTSLFERGTDSDELSDAIDAEGRPITVTFARAGKSVPWKDGMFSVLFLAERHGLHPEASCRTGLCGICVCRIDGGEVEYVVEPLERPRPNEVLVCCARPTTSVVLDL